MGGQVTFAARIRTGIAFIDGEWHVIQNVNGEVRVYDPPFATEAEAEAKADELARTFREVAAERGVPVIGRTL